MGPGPETIDQIIERLTDIVDEAKSNRSRGGYFAALYRKVTIQVKKGIDDGFFDDGERMERLDVIFARRYIDAFESYRSSRMPTQSWFYAFETTERWWPIVLQHLLLGMNAHINLDLGIAAARSVTAEQLPALKNDFDKINIVLATLVDSVQHELAQVWMTLDLLNRYLGSTETAIINFSMRKARDHAWSVAKRLAPLDESAQGREIELLDSAVLHLAHLVRTPVGVGRVVTKAIRLGERGTVPQIIEILS